MKYSALKTALDIFAKYNREGMEGDLGGAAHDVVFLSLTDPEDISHEDRETLDAVGIHYDSFSGSWVAFV